jgi:hypothetical protein
MYSFVNFVHYMFEVLPDWQISLLTTHINTSLLQPEEVLLTLIDRNVVAIWN